MKKTFAAVFLALLLFIMPCTVFASEAGEANIERAMQADEKLTNAWGMDEETFLPKYPDYIGGTMLSEDGKLIVYIKGDNKDERAAVQKAAGDPEILEFVTVKYGYNELQSINDEINEAYNAGQLSFTVNFSNVEIAANNVQVGVLSSDTEAATSYFQSKYGDKVVLYGGYDVVDLDDVEGGNEDSAPDEKLIYYIDAGIVFVSLIAAIIALTTAKKKSAARAKTASKKPQKMRYAR